MTVVLITFYVIYIMKELTRFNDVSSEG